jgi:hypothetical protein
MTFRNTHMSDGHNAPTLKGYIMANKKMRVHAQLPTKSRDLLLRMFRPRLPNVYCQSITYAYGFGVENLIPAGTPKCIIVGIHRTLRHEALVCTLDGQAHRPDGKPFHITLSTAHDVPPAEAGDIDPMRWERVNPVTLDLVFASAHAMITRPQPNRIAAG